MIIFTTKISLYIEVLVYLINSYRLFKFWLDFMPGWILSCYGLYPTSSEISERVVFGIMFLFELPIIKWGYGPLLFIQNVWGCSNLTKNDKSELVAAIQIIILIRWRVLGWKWQNICMIGQAFDKWYCGFESRPNPRND